MNMETFLEFVQVEYVQHVIPDYPFGCHVEDLVVRKACVSNILGSGRGNSKGNRRGTYKFGMFIRL